MKKNYFSLILGLISCITFAQEALITGYVDSPCEGAKGRVLEIYVNGTIDFNGWSVVRQANGKGYTTSLDLSSFNSITDAFIYITDDAAIFSTEFGITENILENGVISSNGDDGFQIVDADEVVIDRFGEDGVDGSGTPWEHVDTFYLRHSGSQANGGDFDPANWTFGELNALDGQGTCNTTSALNTIVSLGSFEPDVSTPPSGTITFEEPYVSVMENGSVSLTVSISEVPTAVTTVDVSVLLDESTAVENQNYTFVNETLTFEIGGSLTQDITITLPDNSDAEPDVLLALELSNPINAELGETAVSVVYILDDEVHIPTAPNTLGVAFGTSYKITGDNPGSEIVAHDVESQRLFVMNSGNASVEVLDFSDPLNITSIKTVDLSAYGTGGTSVATKNGMVAATSVPDAVNENGVIVFMDIEGTIITTVEAGSLPDMITFTPDGNYLLVANEGEPSSDYTMDPEGTISIIDVSAGLESLTQANVTTLDFNAYDSQKANLIAQEIRIFGPGASVSQDLEPEYITVSEDSQTAWVTLQENNAIAVLDLSVPEITDIFPMGLKDHSLPENTLDVSNETDFAFMANWPIKGMYMPDAIANYTVNGNTYYVTANEGDAREYDAYEEEVSLEDITLDASVFPNQEFLQREENLGKIKITSASGDLDGDGEYEEIHVYGGRSFSIYDGNTGMQVYDSGDDFERATLEDPVYSAIFNTTNDENEIKNRSDNKGPEPEAVIVQEIEGEFYAFIGLERIGGFMVYNVSNPLAPTFEGYFNNRGLEPGENVTGDFAPESIVYIAPEDNTQEKGLIVIANEVSATISVYTLENNALSIPENVIANSQFVVYPNPVNGGRAFFTKPTNFVLYDIQGRQLQNLKDATHIDVSNLGTGTYIVTDDKGRSQKLMVN